MNNIIDLFKTCDVDANLLKYPENEYSVEIFNYLKEIDKTRDYNIYKQKEIDINNRLLLVEWMISLHYSFKLLQETLYLSVNILDKYIACTYVELREFQLIAITSMFIACKIEEVLPPTANDFLYISKNKYDLKNIILMEFLILKALKFDILFTCPMTILNKVYYLNLKYDLNPIRNKKIFYLCNFLMEVCLLEHKMTCYTYLYISIASLFCSRKIFNEKPFLSKANFKQLDNNILLECIKEIFIILKKYITSNLNALKNKYSDEKFLCVYSIFSSKL